MKSGRKEMVSSPLQEESGPPFGTWPKISAIQSSVPRPSQSVSRFPIHLQIGKCRTKNFKYVGANELVGPQEHGSKRARYFEQQIDVQRDLEEFFQMPTDIAEHLSHFYGYRAFEVAELAKKRGTARLHESLPYLEAEVPYCVQQEMAVRLSDVIMRRLRIGVTDTWLTMQCLPKCTVLMKNELGWDRNRCYEVVDRNVKVFL